MIIFLTEKRPHYLFINYVLKDYFYLDDTSCNCKFVIRLTQSYNKFTKYIKEFNIQTELYLKKSSFANQVEQTDFFIFYKIKMEFCVLKPLNQKLGDLRRINVMPLPLVLVN